MQQRAACSHGGWHAAKVSTSSTAGLYLLGQPRCGLLERVQLVEGGRAVHGLLAELEFALLQLRVEGGGLAQSPRVLGRYLHLVSNLRPRLERLGHCGATHRSSDRHERQARVVVTSGAAGETSGDH